MVAQPPTPRAPNAWRWCRCPPCGGVEHASDFLPLEPYRSWGTGQADREGPRAPLHCARCDAVPATLTGCCTGRALCAFCSQLEAFAAALGGCWVVEKGGADKEPVA